MLVLVVLIDVLSRRRGDIGIGGDDSGSVLHRRSTRTLLRSTVLEQFEQILRVCRSFHPMASRSDSARVDVQHGGDLD